LSCFVCKIDDFAGFLVPFFLCLPWFLLVVRDVAVFVFELSYKAPEAERAGLFFYNPQIQGHFSPCLEKASMPCDRKDISSFRLDKHQDFRFLVKRKST
jgi:hypothetical protein